MKCLPVALLLCITVSLVGPSAFAATDDCGGERFVEDDETVHIFPTFGAISEEGDSAAIPIHVWVYEEELDLKRKAMLELFKEGLEFEEGSAEEVTLERRLHDFLVDNESRKELFVRIEADWLSDPVTQRLGRTEGNGRVQEVVEIPFSGGPQKGGLLHVSVRIDDSEWSEKMDVLVEPPTGTTVVSDIDDTTKITGVLDKKELLANTFLREFREAPGMSALYRRWARSGAAFHYVSASPWNLHCELHRFADRTGFPNGIYHLRIFQPRDVQGTLEFLKSSRAHKISSIAGLIGRFPKRSFVLVGDTGEADPEVYGELARMFPDQISRIYLREVEGANNVDERFQSAFEGVPATKWSVFSEPTQVGNL